MAAAARLEAQGRRIVHMEVGQPAAGAPSTAIAAAHAALGAGPLGYTETLGIASLRHRIARSLSRLARSRGRPAAYRGDDRLLGGFHPGLSGRIRGRGPRCGGAAGLSAVPAHPHRTRLRARRDRMHRRNSLVGHGETLLREHRVRPLKGVVVASPANPTGTMMREEALADLIRCAEDAGIAVISDEIYHGLDYAFPATTRRASRRTPSSSIHFRNTSA